LRFVVQATGLSPHHRNGITLLVLLFVSCREPAPPATHSESRSERYADDYEGSDIGAQINAASKALGARVGVIRVDKPGVITTPVVLGEGHALLFGPGEWRFRRAPAITVSSASAITGAGVFRTRLILDDGADGDFIVSADFETFTKLSQAQINARPTRDDALQAFGGGVKYFTLAELTLDGNKGHNLHGGAGVRLFGYWWSIHDVLIQRCQGDGLYTEWIEGKAVAGDDAPEAWLTNVKLLANGGNGWTVLGPHDTIATGLIVANSGGWGIDVKHREAERSGAGLMLSATHLYGNTSGGLRTERGANVLAFGLESEANGGPGLLVRSNDSMIQGTFYANGTHGVQIGEHGPAGYAGFNTWWIQAHNNVESQVAWINSGGGNQMGAALYAQGQQRYIKGSPSRFDTFLGTTGGRAGEAAPSLVMQGGAIFDNEGAVWGLVVRGQDAGP
jgi:hypothetical protein